MNRTIALLLALVSLLVLGITWFVLRNPPAERELVSEVQAAPLADAQEILAVTLPAVSELTTTRSQVPLPGKPIPDAGQRFEWLRKPPRESRGMTLYQPLRLRGVVLDAESHPVAKASVMLWPSKTETLEDGRFELEVPGQLAKDARIFAAKPGWQAASAGFALGSPLVLRLESAALEISGIVLQADGTPAVGWEMQLLDGTEMSLGTLPVVLAEDLAAGRTAATPCVTGASGEFVLSGLSPRNYGVQATGKASSTIVRENAIAAGTRGLVMRAWGDASLGELRGMVMNRRGAPVPNVKLTLELCTFRNANAACWSAASTAQSGEDGSFRMTRVPQGEIRLRVSGNGLVSQLIDASEIDFRRECRLTIEQLAPVELTPDAAIYRAPVRVR
ncbi:MAG TPA: carboxypeptidase-like regulatory domain-containing protein [Planctomycetota bacterium]|nr:carboxypeptidase-like regulatory domain-containing protein [Planctomycetota bacterium]